MNKLILTNNDIKNLFEKLFEDNTEELLLKHEPDGDEEIVDLYEYLNLNLYAWKQRLVEAKGITQEYGAWVDSLNYSLNQVYGLVEVENDEIMASQDIDNVSKNGAITFLVPTNKIQNLEYYTQKLRTIYIGKPEKIQNQDGKKLTTYISLGTLSYTGEPEMTPFGEVIECTLAFTISYINELTTYEDMDFQISFDGDDLYNEEGDIVDESGDPIETKYLTMPITNSSIQNIFTASSVPRFQQANLTGQIVTAITFSNTISFYDFNLALTNQVNVIFYGITADRINGIKQSIKSTNIPVYFRIIIDETNYTYALVVTGMDKAIKNSEANITSLTLKTYGKVV